MPANGANFNAPNFAICLNSADVARRMRVFSSLFYLNRQLAPFDNLSFRLEFYNDMDA